MRDHNQLKDDSAKEKALLKQLKDDLDQLKHDKELSDQKEKDLT